MRLVQVTLPGRWLCSFLLVALLSGAGARAADQPAVVAVAGHDASVLRLGDGRRVRLAGIHVPPLADGGLDPAAVLALDGLIGTAGLSLPPAPWLLDRHGRLRVQVHADTGAWLQGELVRRGLALAAPAPDVPEPVLAALLALERTARATGQGLWARGGSGPWPAHRVAAVRGGYVLVRGRVQRVARAQDFVYLNFGDDWRSDFTVRVEARQAVRFARAGLELKALEGRNVEVRGLLFQTNGPMIDLTHPRQIETFE